MTQFRFPRELENIPFQTPGHEIKNSIERRHREALLKGKTPTQIKIDEASYAKLCNEFSELGRTTCVAVTKMLGLVVIVVKEPEWLEVI